MGRSMNGRKGVWVERCQGDRMDEQMHGRVDSITMETMREGREGGREEMKGKTRGKGSSQPMGTAEAHFKVLGERESPSDHDREPTRARGDTRNCTAKLPPKLSLGAVPSEALVKSCSLYPALPSSGPPTSHLPAPPSASLHTAAFSWQEAPWSQAVGPAGLTFSVLGHNYCYPT